MTSTASSKTILIVWSVLAVALTLLVVSVLVVGVAFPKRSCGEEKVGQFPSPNKKWAALVIVENCGATTPFVSMVVLSDDGRSFDLEKDNFFAVRGLDKIEVEWKDNSSLLVRYSKPERIYRQAIVWRGSHIDYQERN